MVVLTPNHGVSSAIRWDGCLWTQQHERTRVVMLSRRRPRKSASHMITFTYNFRKCASVCDGRKHISGCLGGEESGERGRMAEGTRTFWDVVVILMVMVAHGYVTSKLMKLCSSSVPYTSTGLKERGWVGCDSAAGVHRSVDCFQKIRLGRRERDLSCIYPGSPVLKPGMASRTQGEGGLDLKAPAALCSSFPGIHLGLALRSPVCREALCEPVQVRALRGCSPPCTPVHFLAGTGGYGPSQGAGSLFTSCREQSGAPSEASQGPSPESGTFLRPRDSQRERWEG